MERLLEINGTMMALFGVGIFGLLTGIIAKLRAYTKMQEEEVKLNNDAMLAILHNKVYKNGVEYIRRGKVTVGQLNDIEKLYAPYKKMGGNGTAELIIEKVRALPIENGACDDEVLREVE